MNVNHDPWEHIITNHYYNNDLFCDMKDELEKLIKKLIDDFPITSKQFITLVYNVDYNCFVSEDRKIIKHLPHTKVCIDSMNLNEKDLDKFSYHREYDKLKLKTNINIVIGDAIFPIHDDQPKKILTNVIFVSPEYAKGTMIYDKDKKFVKEAVWKTNTSLIFPPKDRVTWHNYESLSGSYRITINQFLVK